METNTLSANFPFTHFSEMVCRHNLECLNSLQREFFNDTFSRFKSRNMYRRFAGDVMHAIEGFGKFQDYNLPRGRYYSVCNTRKMENIHLCYELKAYTNADKIGPIALLDASRKHISSQYALGSVRDALFTLLNGFQVNRFIQRMSLSDSREDSSSGANVFHGKELHRELEEQLAQCSHRIPNLGWDCFVIYFPLEKHPLVAQRCVDLRYPDTRKWFFERYRRGIEGWPGYGFDAADVVLCKRNGPREEFASGFIQMLPALCNQDLGGRLITQVIGADLRRHGTECLIYPSARCDTFALFQNGSLVDSYGWNLLDYRGAGVPKSPAEEGVIYQFLGDLLRYGELLKRSGHDTQKQKFMERLFPKVIETTGKVLNTGYLDPYNPWTPGISPSELADLSDPSSFFAAMELLQGNGPNVQWPFRIIDITDGERQGSFAIEGVQQASDKRENAIAAEFIKNLM
jgi:hypothetical protein